MYCLDSNVWIYFLDTNLPEHERVFDDVAAVVRSKPLFSPTVLQMEVVDYLTNRLSDPEPAIGRLLGAEDAHTAALTSADVDRATQLLLTHDEAGIGGRDATVLAAMERNDVSQLWTHDEALLRMGERLDWLSVTDPVVEDPQRG